MGFAITSKWPKPQILNKGKDENGPGILTILAVTKTLKDSAVNHDWSRTGSELAASVVTTRLHNAPPDVAETWGAPVPPAATLPALAIVELALEVDPRLS